MMKGEGPSQHTLDVSGPPSTALAPYKCVQDDASQVSNAEVVVVVVRRRRRR